jgi:hypothetical protein
MTMVPPEPRMTRRIPAVARRVMIPLVSRLQVAAEEQFRSVAPVASRTTRGIVYSAALHPS